MPSCWRDLPSILLYGLAGGLGDATSLLRYHTFTGHVTGNVVFMMISMAHHDRRESLVRATAIVIFSASTRAGFYLAHTKHPDRWLMVLQFALMGVLLLLGHLGILPALTGVSLFSAALGLQNGVITTIHNVDLHSTFLSGDVTKLLKPVSPFHTKLRTSLQMNRVALGVLIGGFAGGALIASFLFHARPEAAVPAFLLSSLLAYAAT